MTTHDYSVKNIGEIPSNYICPFCKLIFHKPYQLNCGHRICKSCINFTNNEITCLTCYEVSSKENIRSDRGFYLDMEKQSISCSICTWIGSLAFYRKHIDQNHNYRESIGTTTNVYTKQSDQSNRSKLVNNIEACQEIMSDIFSSSCSIFLPQNSSTSNDQHCIRLSQIQEMIRSLSNHLNILINDQQSSHNLIRDSHTLLQTHARNFTSLKASAEINIGLANALKINYDLLAQELWSIKRIVDDPIPTSYCGRYIWKITNVQERIADAKSERQTSIYSSPFYSSLTGYKLCLRLYLNGDSDVRGRFISLFLIIMRNDYDAILHWPFSYEVSFCLIDQSTLNNNQHNMTASFWPDIGLDCFQRPVYNMNHGYGIKEFCSLVEFEQNKSFYIRDNG
ncbi:unnamed protein product [Rotaria sordida]|uniref:TNF receptor-associated factor n=1 Tax=Rotaria sordida TaxID=392033 RepID=A0A814W956_9BILA|nr:unnamed protein product [Rotaria sordida]